MQSLDMPTQGTQDRFELKYMAQLRALLTTTGVPLSHEQDRAAIDTGPHLFVEGPGNDWSASQVRVWFQVKGKRTETLPLEKFRASSTVAVEVDVEHLEFWYAAPEPVYMVVFVEAADVFLAEDVRALVNQRWPAHDFHPAIKGSRTATLRISTSALLNESRLRAMLQHRSMRIDGATFQGRPLGHLLDPLRCELAFDQNGLWEQAVHRILGEHRYRRSNDALEIGPHLSLLNGRFYDTMVWQSSAFAEFGYGPDDDFRDDPAVESVQGPAAVVIDRAAHRKHLEPHEREGLLDALGRPGGVVVFFNGKDLSGTGGAWRSFLREALPAQRNRPRPSMLGHEALTALS